MSPRLTHVVESQHKKKDGPPWLLFLFLAGAFFIIGHDLGAPTKFAEMMDATTLEDLEGGEGEQQPLRQLGGLALGGWGAMMVVLSERRETRITTLLGALILFFVVWAGMSFFWAADRGQTFRRVLLLIFLSLGTVSAVRRFRGIDFLWFALFACTFYLGVGVVNEILRGTFRPIPLGYRFAGTQHPNSQAVNCALLLMASVAWWIGAPERRKFIGVMILGVVYFLLLAGSRTALGSVGAAIFLTWALTLDGYKRVVLISFGITGVVFLMIFGDAGMAMIEDTLEMGRADTEDSLGSLSGRVPLWGQLYGFILERPLLGFGYGGFWTPDHIDAAIEEQGWPLSHAHNAYIDLMLEIGPLGALTYILILVLGARTAFLRYMQGQGAVYFYLTALLLFVLFNGFMESAAIQRSQLTFFLMLAVVHLGFGAPAVSDTARPEAINVRARPVR